MPAYTFIGMDASGKSVSGSVEAEDRQQLDAALERQGIFVIKAMLNTDLEQSLPAPAPPPQQAPATDLEKRFSAVMKNEAVKSFLGSRHRFSAVVKNEALNRFLRSRQGIVAVASFICLLFMADYFYMTFVASTNPYSIGRSTDGDDARIDKIHRGMSRKEAENILGDSLPGATNQFARYWINKSLTIAIRYDATGGSGSPSNRIAVNPKIEITPPTIIRKSR